MSDAVRPVPDAASVAQRFAALPAREPLGEYNFTHFRTRHLARDAKRTVTDRGIRPGEVAPDFTLPVVGGGERRLGEFRGRPVLLHFGSFS